MLRCRRHSARFPSAISGRTPTSTRPTTSASATSGTRGRSDVPRTAPASAPGSRAASPTWSSAPTPTPGCACAAGELSGVEAFSQRQLYARGDLDLAVGFEGMFRLPNGRPPLLRVHDVELERGPRISTLTMGEGPDVLLLHGLGATKSSFFDTAAALSRSYRVHALDLPGFGGSSKPALARYGAPYFARVTLGVMDALGIERAHLVGNSMGGRVALEVGLREPGRVGGLALLCPALAFVRRGYQPLVRLLRPELGLLPHSLGRGRIERQFWSMFADRDLVDPSVADIVVDEFERIYRSAGRPPRLPGQRPLDLPRAAVRPRRPVPAPGGARAARDVRVGLARQADPARLRPPRRALAPARRADPARGLRPRAPGRAAGAHERPADALLRAHRRAGARRCPRLARAVRLGRSGSPGTASRARARASAVRRGDARTAAPVAPRRRRDPTRPP